MQDITNNKNFLFTAQITRLISTGVNQISTRISGMCFFSLEQIQITTSLATAFGHQRACHDGIHAHYARQGAGKLSWSGIDWNEILQEIQSKIETFFLFDYCD